MKKSSNSLLINDLKLLIHLGWSKKERLKKQIVWLDVSITFPKVPKACITDRLEDTFCYAHLINLIQENTANKKFHLVEHLAYYIHHIIKTSLPKKTLLHIRITKYPVIKGLRGGVSFNYESDV